MVVAVNAAVFDTLETLLVPGHRFRLSPDVEDTQLQQLFGTTPDPKGRAESIQRILQQHDHRVRQLAARWDKFREKTDQGTKFEAGDYSDPEFEDAYLAYYFTTNVGKVQLALLELVRAGRLTGVIRLLDIGVAGGVTAIALLDFLIAWSDVCHLYGERFPVTDVQITGIDINPDALDYAKSVVATYADVLMRPLSSHDEIEPNGTAGNESDRVRTDAARWARASTWLVHDLAGGPPEFEDGREPTLVVLANVLHYLRGQSVPALRDLLLARPTGATVLAIEPGERSKANLLMHWRRSLVNETGAMRMLGPCGQEYGDSLPTSCERCWTHRSDHLHRPFLYRALVGYIRHQSLAKNWKPFHEYENKLLSWSYVLLERGTPARATPPGLPERFVAGQQIDDAVVVRKVGDRGRGRTLLCPAAAGVGQVEFEAPPGFQFPARNHGETVTITGVRVERVEADSITLAPLSADGTKIEVASRPSDRAESFIDPDRYSETTRDALDAIGRRLFGFPTLRPFQHRILERSLTGRSVLAIAATGSGKSECYILPAMLLPGVTIVVSPLKALMTDQFEQRIRDRYGLDGLTTFINGDVPFAEREARLRRLELGFIKLIYMTPEQLERGAIVTRLERADHKVGVRYLALDEAHCISQWGHDFRPAYLNLWRRLKGKGINATRIALTATASPDVRDDICDELDLAPEDVLIESANRPEINLIVRHAATNEDKGAALVEELRRFAPSRDRSQDTGAAIAFMPFTAPPNPDDGPGGPASPYVTEFASYLEKETGGRVSIYHGGMDVDSPIDPDADDDNRPEGSPSPAVVPRSKPLGDMSGRNRREEQRAFMSGERSIMVATKGFGMGIDKPDVRLVVHRTPPGTLEGYAQEAGRAGRDGSIADAVLFFAPRARDTERGADQSIEEVFRSGRYIRRVDVELMCEFLRTVAQPLGDHRYFLGREAVRFSYRDDIKERLGGAGWSNTEKKRDDIARILQALYQFRPILNGEPVVFVEEAHRADHRVKLTVLNASAIITSPAEFGRVLRSRNVTVDQLRALPGMGYDAAFWLAKKLDLPLHETVALLRDIEGSESVTINGKLKGQLLQVRGGSPQGWDVRPGAGLFAEGTAIDRYIDAFMAMHNRRRENDRENYERLLTDYVGVDPTNGQRASDQQRCLRAVLLGYLKTDEVVEGNCGSCSACVPNREFERSLEKRQRAVTRIAASIEDLLRQLEGNRQATPSADTIAALLRVVDSEERRGRTAIAYLTGWAGRVLQDAPDHAGARWVDLTAMAEGIFPMQPARFLRDLQRLGEGAGQDAAARLLQLSERAPGSVRDDAEFHRVRAELAERAQAADLAVSSWLDYVSQADRDPDLANEPLRQAYQRLGALTRPDGRAPNPEHFTLALQSLLPHLGSLTDAQDAYAPLVAGLQWQDMVLLASTREQPAPPAPAVAGLLLAWIEHGAGAVADRRAIVAASLNLGPVIVGQLANEDAARLYKALAPIDAARTTRLAATFAMPMLDRGATPAMLRGGATLALQLGAHAPESLRQQVHAAAQREGADIDRLSALLGPFTDAHIALVSLLRSAWPNVRKRELAQIERWLALAPVEIYRSDPEFGIDVLRYALTGSARAGVSARPLEPLARTLAASLKHGGEAVARWSAAVAPPASAERHLIAIDLCLSLTLPRLDLIARYLDQLLAAGTFEQLRRLEAVDRSRLAGAAPTLVHRLEQVQQTHAVLAPVPMELRAALRQHASRDVLVALWTALEPERDPLNADIAAAILGTLQNAAPADVLTSARIEALCAAGRHHEAAAIASATPGLVINRLRPVWPPLLRRVLGWMRLAPAVDPAVEPAEAFIERWRTRTPLLPATADNDAVVRAVVRAWLGESV